MTRRDNQQSVRVRVELARAHDEGLDGDDLRTAVADRLNVGLSSIGEVSVVRRALDARRKLRAPTWHLTIETEVRGKFRQKDLLPIPPPTERLRSPRAGSDPIAVVGAGPAGLF